MNKYNKKVFTIYRLQWFKKYVVYEVNSSDYSKDRKTPPHHIASRRLHYTKPNTHRQFQETDYTELIEVQRRILFSAHSAMDRALCTWICVYMCVCLRKDVFTIAFQSAKHQIQTSLNPFRWVYTLHGNKVNPVSGFAGKKTHNDGCRHRSLKSCQLYIVTCVFALQTLVRYFREINLAKFPLDAIEKWGVVNVFR